MCCREKQQRRQQKQRSYHRLKRQCSMRKRFYQMLIQPDITYITYSADHSQTIDMSSS